MDFCFVKGRKINYVYLFMFYLFIWVLKFWLKECRALSMILSNQTGYLLDT